EKRKEFADFSDVYLKVDYVIITRTDINYIKNFKSLDLTTIGVVEGYEVQYYIEKQYPYQKIIGFKSAEDGLKALSYGEIYAFIIDVASFEYYSKKRGLSNIKISGVSPFFYQVAVGVRKGNRELVSILNKSLKTITEEEYKEAFNRWSTISEPLIDYSLVWKVVLSALVVMVFIFYWNRKLSKEINLRKRVETELVKAKNIAEEATNAKSDFLANMSHEIRTPMNAVIGFTELMEKTPLTDKQESYLSTIKAGGNTLLSLINDILDISKIEAKKLEVIYSSFDLASTIYELKQFFDLSTKQKGLKFVVDQDKDLPGSITLDESRLRQIFFNIISNAIKFTNSGTIKLTTRYTKVEEKVIDLNITIEDTGIGIKEDQVSKIFEPFTQVGDSRTKRITKGTGLGLAITKQLVELMNGSIKAESRVEEGTKFTIEFYNVKVDGIGKEINVVDNNIESITFDKTKVLIVDDVESNRILLRELCEEHDFEILEAENGKEAVEKTKLYVPDMVLMDVRMPVMNGYEAIKLIKEDPNLKDITVIAITASVMSSESKKLKQSQFNGYLRKPISREILLSKFKEFIAYKIESNETETVTVKDELVDAENFFTELNGALYKQYKSSVDKHNLEDIMEFAKDLHKLAKKHHSGTIVNYSEEMKSAVNNFDISAIKTLLSKYEGLVKKVKT
ncbi:MAG: response regulator, partial [Candidatus Delongbacteria bacterium]|nr:response regulator [Candidatus Delongbacteria bacterium]